MVLNLFAKWFHPYILLAFCLLLLSAIARADDVDVRMVIDVSGSMKKNDPQNLRQPAVDLLLRLLPDNSAAGVWTFGKYVNMLVPLGPVDEDWKNLAQKKAEDINSVGLFTNIGEALEKASAMNSPFPNAHKSILLLTDGMVDVDKDSEKNTAEWRRIVDEVIPSLKERGFTVHTVALSKNADGPLMEKLALATGGSTAVANSAEELMQIFLRAFDIAAPAQQVPLEGNTFVVDSSVEEFTALIFRQDIDEQTVLVGPDQKQTSASSTSAGVNWFRSGDYDLITVKQPLEGEWTVKANIAPESRITVVSDLQLKVRSLPNNVYRGAQETLQFMLQEEGKTLSDKTFLSLLTNTVQMGYGEKEVVTKQVWSHDFSQFSPPGDGVYQAAMPQLRDIGQYEVLLEVDGKTFKRRFKHRISVREPFSAELKEGIDENGKSHQIISVRAHSDNIVPSKTQVVAVLTNPERRKTVKPLGLSEFDIWQTLIYLEQSGKYRVQLQIKGEDVRQEAFEYELDPIELIHDPDAEFAASVVSSSSAEDSSSSSSSEPAMVTPEPADEVSEQQPDELATSTPGVLPAWLLYALLGIGNIVILGGGYFLFRKLMSDSPDEEDTPEEVAKEAPPPAPEPEPEAPIEMDMVEDEEEEPPMEDLDPIDSEEPAAMTNAPVQDDFDDGMTMDDDFGVDDLEEDSAARKIDELDDPEDEDDGADLAKEMLKAQGLDLAEDELDDAITNLIDELDGEPDDDSSDDAFGGGSDDMEDFDFGDDDDDDEKK